MRLEARLKKLVVFQQICTFIEIQIFSHQRLSQQTILINKYTYVLGSFIIANYSIMITQNDVGTFNLLDIHR